MEITPRLRGVVRGRTIELSEETGYQDGDKVIVILKPDLAPGEGIRKSAGAWADGGEELDRFLEETRLARKQIRRNDLA